MNRPAGFIVTLMLVLGSTPAHADELTVVAKLSMRSFLDLFNCTGGDRVVLEENAILPGISAMRWQFREIADQRHGCWRRVHNPKIGLSQNMHFSVKSNKPGALKVQVEEEKGELFSTTVEVAPTWATVELPLARFTVEPGRMQDGQLRKSAIRKILIIDASPVSKGERAFWFADWAFTRGATPPGPVDPPVLPPVNFTSRPYAMGFTLWPPDFSQQAIDHMYAFIGAHSDLVAYHFDSGVPWVEALNDQPFNESLIKDWNSWRERIPKNHTVYVGITPFDSSREKLAKYRGSRDNQPLPPPWDAYGLDHPDVKLAFLNYAKRTIDFFHPDYLAIGIEVNIALTKNPTAWQQYKELHRFIFEELKRLYPQLPVFASISMGHFMGFESGSNKQLQKAEWESMLNFNDITGLSAYPYGWSSPGKPVPETYFDDAQALGKPLAITEGGYPSKPFKMFGASYSFSEADQAQYIELLLRQANEKRFAFIAHWEAIDSDKLVEKFPPGLQDFGRAFAYTGLEQSDGSAKQAQAVWDAYLKLPKQ